MGDIFDVIASRRSVKSFLPKFVSWENIAKVLDAGRLAPSSGNLQNWKFIVVLESSQKQNIANACHEQYEIASAGALIIVCSEVEKVERYYGLRGERLYSVQNCAAAIENMLLEAHSLGLGSRWIGAFDEDEVRSLCSIPPEVRPQAIVAIGYAKEVPEAPPKYPLETVVYFHRWDNRKRDGAKYDHNYATIMARKTDALTSAVAEKGKFIVSKVKSVSK